MTPMTGFIILIIALTIQFSLYAIKRFQEPLEPKQTKKVTSYKNKNFRKTYWKNAEMTNGRLAMIGLTALVLNYGLFGWIIPGFI